VAAVAIEPVERPLAAVGDVEVVPPVVVDVDDRHGGAHRRHLRHDVRELRIQRRPLVDEVDAGVARHLREAEAVALQRVDAGLDDGGAAGVAAHQRRRREQPEKDESEQGAGVASHGSAIVRTEDAARVAAGASASRTGAGVTYRVWYVSKSPRWRWYTGSSSSRRGGVAYAGSACDGSGSTVRENVVL